MAKRVPKVKGRFKNALRMAKARKAARAVRRAANRRKTVVNKTTLNVGLGFPKKVVATHKYSDFFTVKSTAGIVAKYTFSANDMFDPNVSGTGHQPMYFDQYCALYNHWVVIGSKCRFKVLPQSSVQPPFAIAAMTNDDATTPVIAGGITTAYEETNGKPIKLFAGDSTDTTKSVMLKYSAKKTFGKNIIGNSLQQGTASAGPTEGYYFDLYVGGLTAADATVCVVVEIEYIAVWTELKDINPS